MSAGVFDDPLDDVRDDGRIDPLAAAADTDPDAVPDTALGTDTRTDTEPDTEPGTVSDDAPVVRRPGRRVRVVVFVVLAAALAALQVVVGVRDGLDATTTRDVFDGVRIAVPLLAALFALLRAREVTRQRRGSEVTAGDSELLRSQRAGWRWTALAMVPWAVGQAWWPLSTDVLDVSTGQTWMFVALLSWMCLSVLALSRLGVIRGDLRIASGLEAAQVSLAIGFLVWTVYLRDRLMDVGALSDADLLMRAELPAAAALVTAMAFVVTIARRSAAMVAVGLGASVIAVANTLHAGQTTLEQRPVELWLHVCWVVGIALVALATLLPIRPPARDRRGTSTTRALAVYVPIAAGLVLWAVGPGEHALDVVDKAAAVIAAVLLVGVQLLLWRERDQLGVELESKVDELDASQAYLRTLLDSIAESVIVLDVNGRIRECNQRACALIGGDRDEVIGSTMLRFIPASEREFLTGVWQRVLAGHENIEKPVFAMPHSAGHIEIVEANLAMDHVREDFIVVSLRDVSDRIMVEGEAKRMQQRFRGAFHAAPTGMALALHETGEMVEVNSTLAEMLRTTAADLIGTRLADIVHPDDLPEDGWQPDDLTIGGPRVMDQRLVRRDGTVLWGATSIAAMTDPSGAEMVIVHVVDVTQQMVSAEQLSWSATHDPVTGLSNRAHFLDRLDHALTMSHGRDVAVLFLDLDRFKVVNDSLGHALGDDLLRTMAQRITESVRDEDLVARFGGDEFTVLLTDAPLEVARAVADRVRETVAAPVLLHDAEVDVTASIGLAYAGGPEVNADDLVRDADAAMYRAKDQGRDRIEVFSPETHAIALRALHTGNELRHGLERGEIVPYFQPIVDLRTGRLSGYEVMARWLHPERGLLLPAEFLAVAEDRGLIGDLGSSILRSALSQYARWMAQPGALGPLTLSVNVSARQLTDRHLVDIVAEALAEAGVPADCLWLEITESALMTDVRSATTALRDLRSLGLHLAVDDFGTGYSSLTYLKRFPVEAIKVDRSFVAGLGLDSEDSTIVEAVVRLGSSLGLVTVAEGVETPLQLARLREIDCQLAQGYLFGRPRPAELLEPFVQLN